MIALGLRWDETSWLEPERIARSLGLFAGGEADSEIAGGATYALLREPRARPRRGWRVSRAPSGRAVLLCGWIDNLDELAANLGFSSTNPESLYGAAIDRWGDEADCHIVGSYAAISVNPDRSVRLSRAPWSAQPLFWAADTVAIAACSIPRPIFAAGHPKRLKPDTIAEMLHSPALHGEEYFYEGLYAVPQGSVVTLTPAGARVNRWYDPHALPPVRLAGDQEYVEAAAALIEDACAAALRPASRPGILLSGGLDSPIIADELLRQLPDDRRLPSFTFTPLPEWKGSAPAAHFGDERHLVEDFAAMHSRLDPHFVDNRGIGFDSRLDQLFLAADTAHRNINLSSVYQGPIQAARDAGCDWLFTADMGNDTYSCDGRWAYTEYLRKGRWGELWKLLRDHPGDDRAMPRRLVARSILPHFPVALRKALRRAGSGAAGESGLIRREAMERLRLEEREEEARGRPAGEWVSSRRQWLEESWRGTDTGNEMLHATEQVFGVRTRAVPQYRPLIEFCAGIPTQQYVRDGQMRYLARRLAAGRMPERQRQMRDYGIHNADWHLRMTPRIAELRAEIDRIGDHPELREIIDVDKARRLLDDWPEAEPVGIAARERLFNAITATVVAARYADYVDGRNVR